MRRASLLLCPSLNIHQDVGRSLSGCHLSHLLLLILLVIMRRSDKERVQYDCIALFNSTPSLISVMSCSQVIIYFVKLLAVCDAVKIIMMQ
mmetsp:Transcript_4815/g.10961  ORF Transcript_4815/g.10961 Transcript_4815/m.10961 type:complete len:91 (-) Transcript_4815:91-363(-)